MKSCEYFALRQVTITVEFPQQLRARTPVPRTRLDVLLQTAQCSRAVPLHVLRRGFT